MKSSNIEEMAPIILAEIQKAQSILLHCHTSPDPDSVGSALAMKFALESLGKKVTVIKGDSDIPPAFMHFPGAKEIVQKNFFEVDLKDFDLFIAVDTSSIGQISRKNPITFPLVIKSVVIDHHVSNPGYADINLITTGPSSTGELLYELFKIWDIKITTDIASNLFIAIYTDTQGLKTNNTSVRTYKVMSELVDKVPNFSWFIETMDNSETPETLALFGLAINSIETFLDGRFAIAAVTNDQLVKLGISDIRMSTSYVSQQMRMVHGWMVVSTMIEIAPGQIKCSLRTNDVTNYPVDKLAESFGGGGHKAAAGIVFSTDILEAKKLIVTKAKELYNL